MQFKKALEASEQYSLDSLGRICPTHEMGWCKEPWKNVATFDDAITAIAESPAFQDDAFPPDGSIQQEEWDELKAKNYLNIEEGFFLCTGVNVNYAVFRFQWSEQIFFNIRPDFFFKSLTTGLNEPPINKAESEIRDGLIDYLTPIQAIQRAIEAMEIIDPLELNSIKWWKEFWKSRDIPLILPENQPTAPAFKTDSPNYPPELAIALQAWQAVSAIEGKGKPKARLRAWLDDNANQLSNEAKERISIVANWDKTGGATRTE